MSEHEVTRKMIGVIQDRRYIDQKKRKGENRDKRCRSQAPTKAAAGILG
jgi:hypothetical protein